MGWGPPEASSTLAACASCKRRCSLSSRESGPSDLLPVNTAQLENDNALVQKGLRKLTQFLKVPEHELPGRMTGNRLHADQL